MPGRQILQQHHLPQRPDNFRVALEQPAYQDMFAPNTPGGMVQTVTAGAVHGLEVDFVDSSSESAGFDYRVAGFSRHSGVLMDRPDRERCDVEWFSTCFPHSSQDFEKLFFALAGVFMRNNVTTPVFTGVSRFSKRNTGGRMLHFECRVSPVIAGLLRCYDPEPGIWRKHRQTGSAGTLETYRLRF